MRNIKYLTLAQKIAINNVVERGGEPFGAVVIRNGRIIGIGRNETIKKKDPTAHAIFLAIRNSNINVRSTDLSGSTLYTNVEPCAMCESAAYWAQISKIVYSTTLREAAKFGYLASQLYGQLCIAPQEQRGIPSLQINFRNRFKYLPFILFNKSNQNKHRNRGEYNNEKNKCKKCY